MSLENVPQGLKEMNLPSKQDSVMIIAGEASGDQHGAKLVRAMQKKHSQLFFCGIGGTALREANVRILVDASELSVIGFTEVFSKARGILKGIGTIKKLLMSLQPDLVILIDFPDFNLHIASIAKKMKIPVLYYISPQIWAWRQARIKRIVKLVDHMAVILPFEAKLYEEYNIPVTFVGHPLLDTLQPAMKKKEKSSAKEQYVIGLLPGSRESEIDRHLPVMLETAEILKEKLKHVTFMVSHAPSVEKKHFGALMKAHSRGLPFEVVSGEVDKVFDRCDLIVAASGTVTLQAAIHGTPLIIIYKLSPLSYWLGKTLIRVPNIGLVNLVAGKQIVPEFVQHHANAENIASAVENMLDGSVDLDQLKKQLLTLRHVLGGAGASERVADIALGMLKSSMVYNGNNNTAEVGSMP